MINNEARKDKDLTQGRKDAKAQTTDKKKGRKKEKYHVMDAARRVAGLVMLMVLAGCDSEIVPPTPTRTLSGPTIEASQVVRPVIATPVPDQSNPGMSDPTAAALPRDAELPPLVVGELGANSAGGAQAVEVTAGDGTQLDGDLYDGITGERVPGVLLIAPNQMAWGDFALRLQSRGFTVLSMNLRPAAPLGDVIAMLNALSAAGTVDPSRLVVIGAEAGADLALVACAGEPLCDGLAMITPLDPTGVGYLENVLPRPLLVASGEASSAFTVAQAIRGSAPNALEFQAIPGESRGALLVADNPALGDELIRWVARIFSDTE